MKQTNPHPVEVVIVVALAAGWAVLTLARALLVPLVALLLTLARWRPSATPQRCMEPPAQPGPPMAPPMLHPLALVAAELAAMPAAQLRALAGIRSKRHRKHDLVAVVAACG